MSHVHIVVSLYRLMPLQKVALPDALVREPVKGMYVWCPGCGHGGHSKCALQWFGGLNEKAVREECPTGCGHKCNMVRVNGTFPRSELR